MWVFRNSGFPAPLPTCAQTKFEGHFDSGMSECFKIRKQIHHGSEPLPMLRLAELGYSDRRRLLP
jgi:hypothetical protein